MKTAILISCLLLAGIPQGATAQGVAPSFDNTLTEDWDTGFRPLPLRRIATTVMSRYQGRLIAVATVPPSPEEARLGSQLVYELRLLTPARDVLNVRIDAETGRFLEVAGRDLLEARRKGPPRYPRK
ncbi:PepSY domain-containing protein [Paracoccus sp. 1_MG-2023]|uniref:PepSY domain-containing protein n=1 Tax=unclassified Paracoccus (in: a-proteobacteria) TaxID=2688777 RepID=UPI001C0A5DC9|nr:MULTISPECIES: PepSY domain-containing protein [unclassified Paracoccus (in: a-proteobacteria)]MBU2958333.1 PepSY domain-containing protein [Paracoccus sp. C2R09]MDO6668460.1 PepSY domain-containing protein [Paracoccus sp. 1_MG-2023]